jgi:hypothetical protein
VVFTVAHFNDLILKPMMGVKMEANANTPTLFDVVKQFKEIKVDDYQRTYAWQKDQIDEFFDDLKESVATQAWTSN